MILLVSGEGPSDIGTCTDGGGECEGAAFKAGPMTLLIDQIVEPIWNYSPSSISSFVFVPEGALAQHSKQIRSMVLPGLKRARETGYFFKNARALAKIALGRTIENCPVGAVLFRDSDGTRSAGNNLWQDKWDSIMNGFNAEGFTLGVPMLPKPKSEVWLLCALQENPYTNCARFEEISGNDASPNSAKMQLEVVLRELNKSYTDAWELISNRAIDSTRIKMPSFSAFRLRMEEVARTMAGLPQTER